MWHVDGYCKLTPYGLAIHGCIDGYVEIRQYVAVVTIYISATYSFSRKIIWLKLSNTNSDPRVIARYYLESIEHAGGMMINLHTLVLSNYCCKRVSKSSTSRLWD